MVGSESVDQPGVSVVVAGSRTDKGGEERSGLELDAKTDERKDSNPRGSADKILASVFRPSSGVSSGSGVSSWAGEAEGGKRETNGREVKEEQREESSVDDAENRSWKIYRLTLRLG